MNGPVVAVEAGSIQEAFELKGWLDNVSDLRGRSSVDVRPTPVGEQGGVTDVLVVAVGSGGTLTVLIGSLVRWMNHKKPQHPLKVSVTDGKKTVKIEVDSTTESVEMVTRILRAIDEHHDGT